MGGNEGAFLLDGEKVCIPWGDWGTSNNLRNSILTLPT